MTGSNAEDTGPLIIVRWSAVQRPASPWLPASAGSAMAVVSLRKPLGLPAKAGSPSAGLVPSQLFAHSRQLGFAAAADRVGEVETFEAPIERPPAQAEHLGGRLLVPASLGQRALDVLALDGRQRVAVVVRRRRERWPLRPALPSVPLPWPCSTISSRSVMNGASARMQARSMTLRSSRTLPSHAAAASRRSAPAVSPLERLAQALGGVANEGGGEVGDVLAPVAQRRQLHLDDVEAVVEVAAEPAGARLQRAGRDWWRR